MQCSKQNAPKILTMGHNWYGTTEQKNPYDDESFDIVELSCETPLLWIQDVNDGCGDSHFSRRESLVMTPNGKLVQVSWNGGKIKQLTENS